MDKLCPVCKGTREHPHIPDMCISYHEGHCPDFNTIGVMDCTGCGMANDEEDRCKDDFHKEKNHD